MKHILLFLTLLIFSSSSINAQIRWTGNYDGKSWEQAGNWDGGVPTEGADVIISIGDSSEIIIINEPVPTLGSLQLLNFAYLILSPNDEELVISGDFTVDETSKLLISISDKDRYSKVVVKGNYYFNGEADLTFSYYVPQIYDSYQIIEGAFGSCDTNSIDIYRGNKFGFDVYFGVECKSTGVTHTVTDLLYTTAIAWDGEAGDNKWTTAANWNRNVVPGPDDHVIINLPSGGFCETWGSGMTEVYSLSIGDNNTLAINSDLTVYTHINNNAAGTIAWNAGAVKNKIPNTPYTRFINYGTLILDSPQTKAIENTMHVMNYGIVEYNQGALNINDGRLYNMEGAEFNFNNDNLTIGYEGEGRHQFGNSSIIRKTNGPGVSSINLDSFQNYFSVIECNMGTLAIGDALENYGGTLRGSGNFQLPSGYVLNGSLSPGNSPGVLTFVGDLTSGPSATFNIEIDGPDAGTEYDQIVVTNEAILEGTINPILGYLPDDDASFKILSATTLSSCDFPAQITRNFGGTDFTFDVLCQDNILYLNGPGVTLTNEDISKTSFAVYPNPVNDILHIKLNSFTSGAWQLVNTLGQIVSEGRFKETNFSVATDGFTAGLYILKVQDLDRDLSYTEKIIVSK